MSVWYYLSLGFCGLVILTGLLGLLLPNALRDLAKRFLNDTGLFVGGGLRILFGASLFMAAPETNWPEVLKPLGVVLIIVGAAIPFAGVERLGKMVDKLTEDNEMIRTLSVVALGVGVFVISLVLETV